MARRITTLPRRNNNMVPIEDVLNIYDDRLWYYIPGFNGYEISNDGYVRSMKHYRQFPFGIMIKPKARANSEDPSFEISNDMNERVTIRRSQLLHLARCNPHQVYGYPRQTCITNFQSRNNKIAVNTRKMKRDWNKNELMSIHPDNNIRYPKFTIVQKPEDMFDYELGLPKVIEPIYSLDDSEYFGRSDCRLIPTYQRSNSKGFVYYAGDNQRSGSDRSI